MSSLGRAGWGRMMRRWSVWWRLLALLGDTVPIRVEELRWGYLGVLYGQTVKRCLTIRLLGERDVLPLPRIHGQTAFDHAPSRVLEWPFV